MSALLTPEDHDAAHVPGDNQKPPGGVSSDGPPIDTPRTSASAVGHSTAFLELRILAESFFDTQQNRISCVNRMERGGISPDMFTGQIDALVAAEHALELQLVRRYRALVRKLLPGVDAWQKTEQGIGEKLLARLLGHLGHPVVAEPYHWEGTGADRKLLADEPFYRTVAQLRSYCGHGDPSRKRRRAMSADDAMALGNPHCKMLTHLLAEATIKRTLPIAPPESMEGSEACADLSADPTTGTAIPRREASVSAEPSPQPMLPSNSNTSAVGGTDPAHIAAVFHTARGGVRSSVPALAQRGHDDHSTPGESRYTYRRLYEQRRAVTDERVHAVECVRCGPSGKPALPGVPWSKAHQHADALRIVGKQILADLWKAAS